MVSGTSQYHPPGDSWCLVHRSTTHLGYTPCCAWQSPACRRCLAGTTAAAPAAAALLLDALPPLKQTLPCCCMCCHCTDRPPPRLLDALPLLRPTPAAVVPVTQVHGWQSRYRESERERDRCAQPPSPAPPPASCQSVAVQQPQRQGQARGTAPLHLCLTSLVPHFTCAPLHLCPTSPVPQQVRPGVALAEGLHGHQRLPGRHIVFFYSFRCLPSSLLPFAPFLLQVQGRR